MTRNRCPSCGGRLKNKEYKDKLPQQLRSLFAKNPEFKCKKCGKVWFRRKRRWITI